MPPNSFRDRTAVNQLVPITASHAPTLAAAAEFFTAQIRNPNTRRAYARAATEFFDWLETRGVTQLAAIESVHVATYIEQLQRMRSAPTAKLRLACSIGWSSARSCRPIRPPPCAGHRRGAPSIDFGLFAAKSVANLTATD